ncbi:type II toxin-antitoxin system VapC family toxin [Aureimonas phyllosphaerae]|uniref:type II toxin-antitoxin system VapC family toxin n=1 Tax=Aureimonas phyllosphaerae TaxID=1166078 RepID=UPI003A5C4EC9
MIVLDTSALIAILADEPEADAFSALLSEQREVSLSAGTAFEADIVARGRWGQAGSVRMSALLEKAAVRIEPFDEGQRRVAAEAYARYGRGSGHPARLNFGDCFSYALARALDAPLLFKGDDFIHTGVRSALASPP